MKEWVDKKNNTLHILSSQNTFKKETSMKEMY